MPNFSVCKSDLPKIIQFLEGQWTGPRGTLFLQLTNAFEERRRDVALARVGQDDHDGLARHQVAHVYNTWTEMPPVSDQVAMPGSRTNPGLVAARFLLGPGKTYESAIENFAPFDAIKQIDEGARATATVLIDEGTRTPSRWTYIFINNCLEGCALRTIEALVARPGR